MEFKVGDKVVCLNRIYTLKGVHTITKIYHLTTGSDCKFDLYGVKFSFAFESIDFIKMSELRCDKLKKIYEQV